MGWNVSFIHESKDGIAKPQKLVKETNEKLHKNGIAKPHKSVKEIKEKLHKLTRTNFNKLTKDVGKKDEEEYNQLLEAWNEARKMDKRERNLGKIQVKSYV